MERCLVKYARILVAALAVVPALACQQPAPMTPVTDKSAIVGKWVADGQTVEVFEDGKIVHTDKLKKETNGRYEFIDNGIIRIEYEGYDQQNYKASIYQENLLLTGVEDSSTSRLTRIK